MYFQNIYAINNLYPTNISKKKDKFKEVLDYYKFKCTNSHFNKKELFSGRIKCINWFEYKPNSVINFNILKARNIDTNETVYFQFVKYNYVIYTKEDINNNNYLKKLFYLSKFNTKLYDIKSFVIENGEKCQVSHYNNLYSFPDYCLNIDNILKDINKTEYTDYIILQTNFPQNKELSSCENNFNSFKFFVILNNINPADAYELKNFPIKKFYLRDNIYFVDDCNIKEFFKNNILLEEDINRYCLSFDLESEVTKDLNINSEKNILTHCGIEYFNTLYYKNFESHKLQKNTSFSFCLINIDFHYKNKILKQNINLNIKDDLYEFIRLNNTNALLEKFIKEENEYILSNPLNMILNTNINFSNVIEEIKTKKKKYIFVKEKMIIYFFFHMLKKLDIDYILTHNGNGYDFPQIGRRLAYLTNKKIDKLYNMPSLYSMEPVQYFESDNIATSFNIKNLIIEAPYFSVDMFNYIKKFHDKLPSYSLKEITKNIYYIKAICVRQIIDNVYKIIPLDQDRKKLKKFFDVLLTSNYCFINDVSYKIIDKSEILNLADNIYHINTDKISNDIIEKNGVKYLKYSILIKALNPSINNYVINNSLNFVIDDYKKFEVSIHLSKDDVNISSSNLYDIHTSTDIADYCIHDTILCRHIFDHYLVKNNIDIFTNLYYTQQNKSILFRNSTNIQGYLLKTCYEKKVFYQKSKKFYLNTYGGGKVLNPKEKFIKEPVLVYDFESLYPSIMINYNINPDKLVLVLDVKDLLEYELLKSDIENRFDTKYYTVVYIIDEKESPSYTITIFSKIDEKYNPKMGLLSHMLNDLKIHRQHYKKMMKKFTNENNIYQSENCNLIQNNIKVLMNSVYGVIGSTFSNISCKFTSQSITAIGARCLMFLELVLDNAHIVNKKIILNETNIKDSYSVLNKIYNPFTETYFNPKPEYKIDIDISLEIILKVVYGDTDSIMIIPKNINKHPYLFGLENAEYQNKCVVISSYIGQKINEFIKTELITNNKLNLQFENIFLNMILQTKKKYSGISCEPDNNITLPLEKFPIKPYKFKANNKGISIKRRDICTYQKNIIEKLYLQIYNIIIESRFDNSTITEESISMNIWEFLEKEINKLIKLYKKNKLNISDFLISCAYTDNYKLEDNHIFLLVNKYNSTSRNIILRGDRFNYIYLISKGNMKYIDTKINDYKYIYDDTIDMSKLRISFEIYIHKIITNIVSIFNNSDIIKKRMISCFKLFLNNNSKIDN